MSSKAAAKSPDRVLIFDTTLRDGEQAPGCTMNLKEKLEVAHQLDRLGVDIIEAGFPIASQGDFEAVQAIASEVQRPVIAGLARAMEKDVVRAGEAVKPAPHRRIHTFIATSNVHVEKKLKMSKEQVIKTAVNAVKLAKTFTDDVEFSSEDAGRTDWAYMAEVLAAVIEAGATTLNIPDTVGYCQPWQFGECFAYLRKNVKGIGKVILSAHCHDDLGLAVANSLAAVVNGARQVECTINGLGERAGNASLEEIVMNLKTRHEFFKVDTNINTEEIYRTSRLVSKVTGIRVQPNKAIVGGNAFAHEAGIHQDGVLKERTTYEIMTPESVGWTGESMVMGKHSGRHAFKKRLASLGYDNLKEDEINMAFERFKHLCDKKKTIFDDDLYAIVEDEIFQSAQTYELIHVQTTTGTDVTPTATVKIRRGQDVFTDAGVGDGPVDAVYKTIERILGISVDLEDYNLEAVTAGEDALGRVEIKIRSGGRSVKGHGTSTDVIVASAKAFVSALNR
ncbi:MAG: 2-isopropylmalate synthase, partial [bacterium]